MKLFRADNLIDLEMVNRTSIAILGWGSLGSLTTSYLALPWKKIVLVDPDKLEDKNVERHLVGYSGVGEYKVELGKKWLVDRGLDPKSIITSTDPSKELELISGVDLVIVSIDDPESCYRVNQFSVGENIPAIYGGVYPMGVGGQTVIVSQPNKSCYLCAEKMTGALEYKGKSPDGDYGVDPMSLVSSSGKVNAVPALKYSVGAIASDMARAALGILAGEETDNSILIQTQTWDETLNLRSGASLNAVSGFIGVMSDLGLVRNMRLMPKKGGYVLSMNRGKIALDLKRWDSCPAHSVAVSPDQI